MWNISHRAENRPTWKKNVLIPNWKTLGLCYYWLHFFSLCWLHKSLFSCCSSDMPVVLIATFNIFNI